MEPMIKSKLMPGLDSGQARSLVRACAGLWEIKGAYVPKGYTDAQIAKAKAQ